MTLTEAQVKQLRDFAPDHYKLVKGIIKEAKKEPPPEFVLDLSTFEAKMTVADMEDIEDIAGAGLSELATGWKKGRVKGMAALLFVMRRKDDPAYTLKQARSLPLTELVKIINGEDEGEIAPLGDSESPTA